jgi:hypothetical protein
MRSPRPERFQAVDPVVAGREKPRLKIAWRLAVDVEIGPSHNAESLELSGVHESSGLTIRIKILVQDAQHAELCPLELLPASLFHGCC